MSIRKIAPIAFLVVLVGIAAYLLIKERVTSEEARIRALIVDIERAVEKKKLSKCLGVVADNYTDNFGQESKAKLEKRLHELFQMARKIDVTVEDVSIDIRGDEADIAMTVIASAELYYLGHFSLNNEVEHTRFELLARKDHGHWKVVRATGVDTYK
ncbi:MAG: hypothetical protein JW889_14340 [Verrucomicrobia bacterium]|nr:hypothetical protein [Verrucomicrobiota bacterium]